MDRSRRRYGGAARSAPGRGRTGAGWRSPWWKDPKAGLSCLRLALGGHVPEAVAASAKRKQENATGRSLVGLIAFFRRRGNGLVLVPNDSLFAVAAATDQTDAHRGKQQHAKVSLHRGVLQRRDRRPSK